MFDLAAVQAALRSQGLDGWLLYDFRGLNVLARRVLGFSPQSFLSRRWFYFIPAAGEPRKLVHRIEPGALDSYPGPKIIYLRWQELEAGVGALVHGASRVAMEYVPRNANPYVSRVDAGTVELVKSFGVEVVPSGDLVQTFEACWDDEQWAMHLEAAKLTRAAFDVAFGFIAERVRSVGSVTESAVQGRIMDFFAANRLVTDHPPIVGVGPHSGDPHYAPTPQSDAPIRAGDFVLVDLWAKLDRPRLGDQRPDAHGLCRHRGAEQLYGNLHDRSAGPRRRHRASALGLRQRGSAPGVASGPGSAGGHRCLGIRSRLLSSYRTQYRSGDPR